MSGYCNIVDIWKPLAGKFLVVRVCIMIFLISVANSSCLHKNSRVSKVSKCFKFIVRSVFQKTKWIKNF